MEKWSLQVSLEHCSNEVFVHLSAVRCWDMVRERVNQEITKQHKLGKLKLPPLQPPGSLDGMEMFGFSSPAIIQVIPHMFLNLILDLGNFLARHNTNMFIFKRISFPIIS